MTASSMAISVRHSWAHSLWLGALYASSLVAAVETSDSTVKPEPVVGWSAMIRQAINAQDIDQRLDFQALQVGILDDGVTSNVVRVRHLGGANGDGRHGSKVASVMAAVGAMDGVFPGLGLVSAKIVARPQDVASATTVIAALQRLVAEGVNVAVMAYAWDVAAVRAQDPKAQDPFQLLEQFLSEHAEFLLVVPGHNYGGDIDQAPRQFWPLQAKAPNLLRVNGYNQQHQYPGFGHRGLAMDIAAPGIGFPVDLSLGRDASGIERFGVDHSSNSLAAGIVAAAAAVARAADPQRFVAGSELRRQIIAKARPLAGFETINRAGGSLDLHSLLGSPQQSAPDPIAAIHPVAAAECAQAAAYRFC